MATKRSIRLTLSVAHPWRRLTTLVTVGLPVVSVPVLSNTTVVTFAASIRQNRRAIATSGRSGSIQEQWKPPLQERRTIPCLAAGGRRDMGWNRSRERVRDMAVVTTVALVRSHVFTVISVWHTIGAAGAAALLLPFRVWHHHPCCKLRTHSTRYGSPLASLRWRERRVLPTVNPWPTSSHADRSATSQAGFETSSEPTVTHYRDRSPVSSVPFS